jgi:hypothetical protein
VYWTKKANVHKVSTVLSPAMCEVTHNVKSWAHCPSHASSVNLQPLKGMDLNGAHQEDFTIARSSPRCWTMCISHLSLIFLLVSFTLVHLSNILYTYVALTIIIFFWLINHNNRIKTSVCPSQFLGYTRDSCKQ